MSNKVRIKKHPCFSEDAHLKFARIHLPVAPLCNIGCKYCIRSINKVENRPGVASRILTPEEALQRVRKVINTLPLTVVGIAGPGDPLANKETFETFELIEQEFPQLMKCLSTNGLLLLDNLSLLKKLRLSTLTVTVNAIEPKTAKQIYDFVILDGKRYKGLEAAKILIERQVSGIREAVKLRITTKINTVFMPQINLKEIPRIAKLYGSMGVSIMNIMPLISIYKMADRRVPTCEELRRIRDKCERYIKQFRRCKQCRADAIGIPGLEKKDHLVITDYFHF